MMNIAIAGSTGFLGKNLSKYLVEKGYNVIPLYTRVLDWEINYKNQNIDVIINLIGKAHDHENKATEMEYYNANVKMAEQLYEFYKSSTATLFIHISSMAAVTEIESDSIITEEVMPYPFSTYGRTKLMGEQALIAANLLVNKKLVILRPTMIHGPGDKGNLSILYKIINMKIPYPLGNYKNERSFLNIENFCFSIKKIIQNQDKVDNVLYNISDDEPLSTEQIIRTIGNITEKKIIIINTPKFIIEFIAFLGDYLKLPLNRTRLKKMSRNLIVSNYKLKKLFGVEKMPQDAQKGLEDTVREFKNFN
jgi:nucleoside-diphosphate-sugar epimerase